MCTSSISALPSNKIKKLRDFRVLLDSKLIPALSHLGFLESSKGHQILPKTGAQRVDLHPRPFGFGVEHRNYRSISPLITKGTILKTAALKTRLSEIADHQLRAELPGRVADLLMMLDVDRLCGARLS